MKPVRVHHRRGFLLIEGMIASVILAVAALGIVSLLLSAHEQQAALQENSTAVLLAKQLMEEIAAKPFGAAAPVVPRSAMVTANQYNGYTDVSTGITTLGGETFNPADSGTYTRSVRITNSPTPVGSIAPSSDLVIVTVTVITPAGESVILSRLLSNVTWRT